jgi:RimJ/RimL family protein N-acetyltransferase
MKVRIRRADVKDAELLWRWRNDSVVRQNSFHSDPIPWNEHESWFAKRLGSPDTVIYILEEGRLGPVAQARYERRDRSVAEVHLTVGPAYRSKGYGKNILTRSIPLARSELGVTMLEAYVKKDNAASIHLFLGAGFKIKESVVKSGHDSLCLLLS